MSRAGIKQEIEWNEVVEDREPWEAPGQETKYCFVPGFEVDKPEETKEEKKARLYSFCNTTRFFTLGFKQLVEYGTDIEGGVGRHWNRGWTMDGKRNKNYLAVRKIKCKTQDQAKKHWKKYWDVVMITKEGVPELYTLERAIQVDKCMVAFMAVIAGLPTKYKCFEWCCNNKYVDFGNFIPEIDISDSVLQGPMELHPNRILSPYYGKDYYENGYFKYTECHFDEYSTLSTRASSSGKRKTIMYKDSDDEELIKRFTSSTSDSGEEYRPGSNMAIKNIWRPPCTRSPSPKKKKTGHTHSI